MVGSYKYSNKTEKFKFESKIIICCNEKPNVSNSDQAFWDRCKILEFKTRFVE
jgi:phage/plasmid-associated DNA primase